jgi:hypothetical protein
MRYDIDGILREIFDAVSDRALVLRSVETFDRMSKSRLALQR